MARWFIDMSLDDWLEWAIADAERRGLPELKPLLESFARALDVLRRADFNDRADGIDTRHADR
jgi:hypothetical protein